MLYLSFLQSSYKAELTHTFPLLSVKKHGDLKTVSSSERSFGKYSLVWSLLSLTWERLIPVMGCHPKAHSSYIILFRMTSSRLWVILYVLGQLAHFWRLSRGQGLLPKIVSGENPLISMEGSVLNQIPQNRDQAAVDSGGLGAPGSDPCYKTVLFPVWQHRIIMSTLEYIAQVQWWCVWKRMLHGIFPMSISQFFYRHSENTDCSMGRARKTGLFSALWGGERSSLFFCDMS